MKTKYTTIQDGSLDLHYNESFSFKVPPEDVDRSCLSIMGKIKQSATTVAIFDNCINVNKTSKASFKFFLIE